MNAPEARTVHEIAEQLRNAAAWLQLAADRLDAGDVAQARQMAQVGAWGCEPLPGRIADLELRRAQA